MLFGQYKLGSYHIANIIKIKNCDALIICWIPPKSKYRRSSTKLYSCLYFPQTLWRQELFLDRCIWVAFWRILVCLDDMFSIVCGLAVFYCWMSQKWLSFLIQDLRFDDKTMRVPRNDKFVAFWEIWGD